MTFRERLPSILIYTITIVVLIGIILFIQPPRLMEDLLDLGLWGVFILFLVLLLLYIADMLIRIYRWQILLIVQGVKLPLKSLVLPVVSALAINLFTIARAGETVRMYALKRNYETKYSDTLSSIVIEQVLSIVGLLFVIATSLFFVGSSLLQNSETIQQLVVIIFLSSVLGLIALFLMMLKPDLIERLIRIFPTFIEKRLNSAYQAFQTGIKGLRLKPLHLILGIITSASIWVIEGIMIYVIAITVLPDLTLIDFPWAIAASCAGNITFIIPILPGAMGEYEFVLAFILMNSPNYPIEAFPIENLWTLENLWALGPAARIAFIDRLAKSLMLGLFGGYATLRLGGKEIIRLRKDFFSVSKKPNELEKEMDVDVKIKPTERTDKANLRNRND
ncbi:MAG: flippase-like domain-containing protein [Candidatus Heimdallarchaeota archaeon]|nr:MAG: flippase-like domain-containing protein [Candidatus Heimdallarchaeota archaeon]